MEVAVIALEQFRQFFDVTDQVISLYTNQFSPNSLAI
jgi:hypothetical protein